MTNYTTVASPLEADGIDFSNMTTDVGDVDDVSGLEPSELWASDKYVADALEAAPAGASPIRSAVAEYADRFRFEEKWLTETFGLRDQGGSLVFPYFDPQGCESGVHVRAVDGTDCRFTFWSDISASQLESYLADLRLEKEGQRGISAQSHNFYLAAFKQFCRWLHRDRRAGESPVHHLQGINVKTDRRHDRRALTVKELIWLLDTTEGEPERGKVSGTERALLYRVAAETGLRANELRTLTGNSFDFAGTRPTVKILASCSKHRHEDVQVLKADTAALLRSHLERKLPTAPALRMPTLNQLAKVLRKDLAAARQRWLSNVTDAKTREEMERSDFLAYCDRNGQYADFHAFRHITGSFLAAAGVNPKVAQTIMRHSDIRLTMNTYSHSFREDEADAIERLPDLSRRLNISAKTGSSEEGKSFA